MSIRFAAICVATAGALVGLTPLAGVASPVYATSTITFSGRVTSGTDVSGVFGQAGADLSGLRYEMSYELSAALEEWVTFGEYEGWRYEYFTEELSSYISAVSLRINNHGFRFASTDWSLARLDSGAKGPYYPGGLDISFASNNMAPVNQNWTIMDYSTTTQVFVDPTDHEMRSLLTPMVRRAKGPQLGSFGLIQVLFDANGSSVAYPVQAHGQLNAQWMRITEGGIAPIPLPASVGPLLLTLGLGGIFAWRRRQR